MSTLPDRIEIDINDEIDAILTEEDGELYLEEDWKTIEVFLILIDFSYILDYFNNIQSPWI